MMQTPNAPQNTQGTTPVVTAPVPGTPEYDAAMAAKFDNVGVEPSPSVDAPKKPEGVPDKFWNADKGEVDHAAWAKSTAELEAALTKSRQQPQQKPAETPTVDPVKVHADKTAELRKSYAEIKAKQDAKPEELAAAAAALADHLSTEPAKPVQNDEAEKVLANAGLKLDDFRAEYAEKGELSPESYEKLAKGGIDKSTVDTFIEGQKAIAAARDAQGYALAGGQENFSKMTEWARSNLTEGEKVAFNNAVTFGTIDEMKLAISGLSQRYTSANGVQPELLGGGGGTPPSTGFRSRAEQTAAIRDPRYAKDPAYRADVQARIAASGELM